MTDREIAAAAAVLAHVENLSREEAERRIREAIERGDRHLDVGDSS